MTRRAVPRSYSRAEQPASWFSRAKSHASTHALCLALSVLYLAFAGACTDPVFAPGDASDANGPGDGERETGPDASSPVTCDGVECDDAGLDEVRAKWAGHYAARSTLFSFDDPLKTTGKLLSIVSIVPTSAGGLALEEEMCFFEGGWSLLFTGQAQYEFVDTRGSAALSYNEDGFDSELLTLHVGYGPTPTDCRPGSTLQRRDEQVWLPSTCDCPRSEGTPTSPRDCRVTDQEGDRKPGATFSATIETSVIVYRVTQEERVQLRHGYRRGDLLYAERVFDDTTRILDCTINGTLTAASGCPIGAAKNCPSTYNKVLLVPIEPDFKCKQVIAQEQGLFVSVPPPFPQACPSDVSGSAARTL